MGQVTNLDDVITLITASRLAQPNGISTRPTGNGVIAGAPINGVVAGARINVVIAEAPINGVIAVAPSYGVIAPTAEKKILRGSVAGDRVVAITTQHNYTHRIRQSRGVKRVVTRGTGKNVAPIRRTHRNIGNPIENRIDRGVVDVAGIHGDIRSAQLFDAARNRYGSLRRISCKICRSDLYVTRIEWSNDKLGV